MATREEKRLGVNKSLGTSWVEIGQVPAGKTGILNLHVTNLTSGVVTFSAFIAADSWTTGEPTGSDLIAPIFDEINVASRDAIGISWIPMEAEERLVVVAGTADSLSVIAGYIEVTP